MSAHGHEHDEDGLPHLPPPTPWPLVLGAGITLMMAGLIVFLRGAKAPGELVWPLLGVVLFFVALIMMLRDDVIAAREDGGHHG